jgi:hypothetical protein
MANHTLSQEALVSHNLWTLPPLATLQRLYDLSLAAPQLVGLHGPCREPLVQAHLPPRVRDPRDALVLLADGSLLVAHLRPPPDMALE